MVGISINFLSANFSNSTNSTHSYVWKGEIVNEFIESTSISKQTYEIVNSMEDFGDNNYVVVGCTYVAQSYDLPPTDGQVPRRVCNGWEPCKERAVYIIDNQGSGNCFFFPE